MYSTHRETNTMTVKGNGPIWEVKTGCGNITVNLRSNRDPSSGTMQIDGDNYTIPAVATFWSEFYLQFLVDKDVDEEQVVEWKCLDTENVWIPAGMYSLILILFFNLYKPINAKCSLYLFYIQ